MDEKKRKILLVAGGVVALIILTVILLFIVGGDDAPSEPAMPVAEAPVPEEDLSADSETADVGAEDLGADLIERLDRYAVRERTTLQAVAAREDVYDDSSKWWALFAENPDAVRYLFKDEVGNWNALVAPGSTLEIPEPRDVPASEQAALRRGFNAFAVQFGSYTERYNADELMARLTEAEANMDFYESPLTVDGIPRIRIRAGLFSRWGDAEAYGRRIHQRYDEVKDYYVVAVPSREESRVNSMLARIYQ